MDRSYNCPEAYLDADLDFHLTLAEPVTNPIFLSLIDSMANLLREQRMRILQVPGKAHLAMSAHLQQVTTDSNASTAQPMFLKAGVT
jgi:DNA-binding FadR family transcriptional regulator